LFEDYYNYVDVMYNDGTRAHGLSGTKNKVNTVFGKNAETDEKSLLGLKVNKS